MKVVGKIIRHTKDKDIIVRGKDGKYYQLPRMSATRIVGDGTVEFESMFARAAS